MSSSVDKRIDLTTGSVWRHVWRMTPPMMFAFFAMLAFNLVDTWFVAKLGTEPLAAMGFTFPIVMIVHSIAMGIGLGVSSCVSRAIGAQDDDQVKHLATYSLLLTLVVMSVLTLLGLIFLPHLLTALGAEGDTLELARQYLFMLLLFVPLGALPMVSNNAIRATGDTVLPSVIMSVAAVVNLVLDPILIFGWGPIPAMGIRGAALGTGLARMLSMVWALWVMHHRCHLLTIDWRGLRDMLRVWGSVLHVALPSSATNVLMPLTMGIVTRLIATHGEAAVAATAAGQRIEHFTYLLPIAMGTVLVPIMGQNWGAGRVDRVREVWGKTVRFGMVYAAVSFVLILPLRRPVASLFSDDAGVVALMSLYLPIMIFTSGFQHIFFHTVFSFNAIRKPVHASLLTVLRSAVLVAPLAWIGGRCLGVLGVYAGMTAASTIAGVVAWAWFRRTLREAGAEVAGNAEETSLP